MMLAILLDIIKIVLLYIIAANQVEIGKTLLAILRKK